MATYPYYWRPPTDEELVNDPNASPEMREAAYQRWREGGPTPRRPDPTSQNRLYAGAVAAGRIAPGMSLDRNTELMQQFLSQGPPPMAFSSTPPNPTTDPQGYNAWYMQHGDVGFYRNPTLDKPSPSTSPSTTPRFNPSPMGRSMGPGPMYGGPMVGEGGSYRGFSPQRQQTQDMMGVMSGGRGGAAPMYGGFSGPMPSYGGFGNGAPQRQTVMRGVDPIAQQGGSSPSFARYLPSSGMFMAANGQTYGGPGQAWSAMRPPTQEQSNPMQGYQFNPLQSFTNMSGFGQPMGGWSGGRGNPYASGGNPFGGGFSGFGL